MWLGFPIDFIAEAGAHVPITAWSTIFIFFPAFFFPFLLFASSLPSFHFPSPPSIFRYLPLLRVASSVQQRRVLLEYVCFPSNNISLSDLLASFVLGIIFISESIFVLLSFRSYFLVLRVVFSCSVRWYSTCSTHEFAFFVLFLFFGLHLSRSL